MNATECAPDADLRVALDHHRGGRLEQAERIYRGLLAAAPQRALAAHLLGMLACDAGRLGEAVEMLGRAVELEPGVAEFRNGLGMALGRSGRAAEAAAHLGEAVRLAPRLADARNNLGVALEALGLFEEAVASYGEAVRLDPRQPGFHVNRGNALRRAGRPAEALASYAAAAERGPPSCRAAVGMAEAYQEMGRGVDAAECYRAAARLGGGTAEARRAHDSFLLSLHYLPGVGPDQLFREHLAWAETHAAPLYPPAPHPPPHVPHARLRIGYLSPDLRQHPVAQFLEPVLAAHDRSSFETYCYSDMAPARHDETTARLKRYADQWRDTDALDDERLTDLIRGDRVDVLVDLCGHMAGNRLPVLARRAAPVQVTYLGYPDTTGMRTVDFRITDSLHDPPGETDRYHTERLVRLDPCCWCYHPGAAAPPVGDLPAARGKAFTFGCFNRLNKVTPAVVRVWARILRLVPHARLAVLVPARGNDPGPPPWFEHHGIPPGRCVAVPRAGRGDYLGLYDHVDVALDPFPYAGHTTTCDALYQGVPTVSLAGPTHASRAGLSVMSAVGLSDWVAFDDAAYVRKAVAAAADRASLRALRAALRPRMRASVLMNGPHLARRLEDAFRAMAAGKALPPAGHAAAERAAAAAGS